VKGMIEIVDSEARSSEPSLSEMERLEEMARREIRKAQTLLPRRRAFLIFRVGDLDQVLDFCGMAKEIDPHLDFIDFALEASSMVIVLVGKTTHDCEWVDWEIRESLNMSKFLIALRLGDEPSLRTPNALKEHRIKLLPWNQTEIREIIRKNAGK
jgi:hypothetical protein